MKVGDTFTISGVYAVSRRRTPFRNPDRRWWQFWKPKWRSENLQVFTVSASNG